MMLEDKTYIKPFILFFLFEIAFQALINVLSCPRISASSFSTFHFSGSFFPPSFSVMPPFSLCLQIPRHLRALCLLGGV